MADLALVRIDNRLIHGQVATGFLGKLGVRKVIVIDDKTATNEFARDVLALAVPPGAEHEVYTVIQAADAWKENQFGSGSVMVIIKSIPAAFEAYEKGFRFQSLMVGGTATGADRTKVDHATSLTAAESGMLDQLTEQGVEIIFQEAVQSKILSWKDVKKKLPF